MSRVVRTDRLGFTGEISGSHVYLRELKKKDASAEYVSWLADPITTKFLESGSIETSESDIREYISEHFERSDSLLLGAFRIDDDQHLGNVKLEPVSWRHQSAVLGLLIGNKSQRGKGIGTEVLRLCIKLAFEEIGLHRVSLGVNALHDGAIRCYEKCGFKQEGIHRESQFFEDRFVDSLSMAILRSDFELENAC